MFVNYRLSLLSLKRPFVVHCGTLPVDKQVFALFVGSITLYMNLLRLWLSAPRRNRRRFRR